MKRNTIQYNYIRYRSAKQDSFVIEKKNNNKNTTPTGGPGMETKCSRTLKGVVHHGFHVPCRYAVAGWSEPMDTPG